MIELYLGSLFVISKDAGKEVGEECKVRIDEKWRVVKLGPRAGINVSQI